jgi:hypothetical protein
MEKFQELRIAAKTNIEKADHMISVTYPLVKDTKLLLPIMENVFLGLNSAMNSVLYYDLLFKRIPQFPEDIDAKIHIFRGRCVRRYKIDESYATLIQEVKSLVKQHKTSPIEFTREGKFVMCDHKYNIQTITPEQIKQYINKAKLFIEEVNKVTSKNEGMFR